MKRIFGILAVTAVITLTTFGVVRAASETTSELTANTNYTGLYARSADKVVLAGNVDGDVWLAGSTVEVTGNVNGNVYAAGERIKISGTISGSVHAAGSDVRLEGVVGGTVYAAGSHVESTDSFKVGHAAALAGSEVVVNGQIGNQLYAGASRFTLAGTVGQSARVEASDIKLTSQASVAGDFTYGSQRQPEVANDRAIQGKIIQDDTMKKVSERDQAGARIIGILLGLIWNIVLAAVLLAIAPRLFQATYEAFRLSPMRHSVKGLAFLILVPVGIIFGLVTIIGIPAMVLAILAYVAVILVAPVAISYYLGQQINARTHTVAMHGNSYTQLLMTTVVGLLVFTVLTIIPVFGGLFGTLLYLAGVGMVISRGFGPLQARVVAKSTRKSAKQAAA